MRGCKQSTRESLRAYIQRWTILKNLAEGISDESAIDAFRRGLQRVTFREQLGQLKVKTLSQLLEHANNWADGEDSIRNELNISPDRDDREYEPEGSHGGGRNFNRRKKRPRRNYNDDRGLEMVVAGFPNDREG